MEMSSTTPQAPEAANSVPCLLETVNLEAHLTTNPIIEVISISFLYFSPHNDDIQPITMIQSFCLRYVERASLLR